MKKLLLILSVFTIFSCDEEIVKETLIEVTRNKIYKIVLVAVCNSSSNINSVCVSKSEYEKYNNLPKSCNDVTINSIDGNTYSGIISSFNSDDTPCKSK